MLAAQRPLQPYRRCEMATTRHRGRFRSEYTDDMRLEAIGLVANAVSPNEPMSVTQMEFDIHAADVIARERPDWPEPPTARALWMQLTRRDEPRKRSWRELIELAVTATSIAHATSANTREEPLPDWFEEPHVVFAVRRVHLHLDKPETLTLDQYDAGRADLLGRVRGERREQLTLLLPKGSQLAHLADGEWNVILELCGLPPVPRQGVTREARAVRPRGYWTSERIADRLVDYLDEFEGVVALRQKHFIAVRVGRDWPTWDAIRTQLINGRNDVRWDEALTIARRERRRRKRAA